MLFIAQLCRVSMRYSYMQQTKKGAALIEPTEAGAVAIHMALLDERDESLRLVVHHVPRLLLGRSKSERESEAEGAGVCIRIRLRPDLLAIRL